MKKETAILGFIVIGAAAFLIGRQMTGTDGDTAPGATAPAETAQTDKATDKAAPAKNDSDIIPVGSSYTYGPADAPVTIVEFSEFQCPFCKRVGPTIDQIKKDYPGKVRIVFKHNPLSFHADAPYAAKASLAAGKQGKFWEMHDKLFENQREIKPENIEKYAQEIGLDMARFKADVDSPEIAKMIEEDQKLAEKVGARGTPNFLINGEQLSGAQPIDRFKAVIDKQLAEAEAAVKAGTAPDAVYAAMVKKNFKAPSQQPNAAPADDSKTVYKVPVGSSPMIGGKEPLVTIIEFSEFECPFCKRVGPTLDELKKDYGDKIAVVFKHNPLPFHKNADPAARAAIAAGMQGKFWEMHDKLFENQKALAAENLEQYAKDLGLDMAKWKADMESEAVKKQIAEDQALANTFGARGTPNFFINGRKLTGARPTASFKEIIDDEIKKAEALLAKGTPRAELYAALTKDGKTKADAPAPRPRQQPAEDKTVYNVPVDSDDAIKGAKDALVTVIVFSEFQCPFCNRVLPTLKQIEEKYGNDVRVVFKHNPLPFHKDAPYAAQAAIAAGNQGKFWEMHDKLFANQKDLGQDAVLGYAQELGLDMGKFKADVESEAAKAAVKTDMDLANGIGARGTPNFFINGRKLVGAQPFPNFEKLIDEELAKAKALVAKGTPRDQVYAAIVKDGATKAAPEPGQPQEDPNKVWDVKVNPNDAVKGPANAKITIVEFSEFQCPFCKRVGPTIDQIMKEYAGKVRIVFKHNPLSFHKDAPLASQAALAAGKQGKFWEMHDMLFENQRALQPADIEKYAQEIGLNMTKFKADLESDEIKKQIAADQALANEVGARGTPTFFINGRKLRGAQPFEQFKQVIDEELKK
ncbi:MAG: thioredoxin domain-containing protein [Myxococcales bacterium]|nr:thioredoxin domain-containing protein [Myxococcales bacterium]